MSAIVLIIVLVISALFFILLFCVALFEKHPLEQYAPIALDQVPEPSPYFLALNESARALGFEHVGAFQQQRQSGVYRAYYSLWLAPDRRTLARICGGKVLNVTEKKLFLTSFLENNRLLESADFPATHDLSDLTDRKTLLHAHLEELYPFHQNRLAAQPIPPRQFAKDRAFQMIQSIGQMKAARLVELRLARYTNPEQTIWSYTAEGAFRICTTFTKVRDDALAQAERSKLKRPGDA
jgi:hypothetical protein